MNTERITPATLDEALEIRAERQVTPVAGGTDIMVRHRRHAPLPVQLDAPPLFIAGIPGLRDIDADGEMLSVGAAVTLSDLASHPDCPRGLKLAIGEFASPAIRNAGTIGGNVCNASPAADSLPFLYAVDACLILSRSTGERELPVREFITGPGSTMLESDELLTRITFPRESPGFVFYRKVAPRRSNALSKLSVYAQADLTDNSTITRFRLALGAVAPTVVRLPSAEDLVDGVDAAALRKRAGDVVETLAKSVHPIDDQRSTATYRRNTALKLVRHLLEAEIPRFLETQ